MLKETKAVKFDALLRLNNSKLKVLKEISDKTENGAKFIHFNDLSAETGYSRHVIHDAVKKLAEAQLIYFLPGEKPGEQNRIGIRPNVLVKIN